MLFKGLILLSAAGVKIREHKNAAAARHAVRAAAMLRLLMKVPQSAFERALGMSPAALAECAEMATRIPAELQATAPGQPQPVFNFILGPSSRGSPRGSQKRNGHHFDREIIVLCVRWYLRYKLSFRDLVEMMAERGLSLAHTTIMRWIQRYVPEFERRWNRFVRSVARSWRVDETYVGWLRSKGNSIEGGTSEIMLDIVAKRLLELPAD